MHQPKNYFLKMLTFIFKNVIYCVKIWMSITLSSEIVCLYRSIVYLKTAHIFIISQYLYILLGICGNGLSKISYRYNILPLTHICSYTRYIYFCMYQQSIIPVSLPIDDFWIRKLHTRYKVIDNLYTYVNDMVCFLKFTV